MTHILTDTKVKVKLIKNASFTKHDNTTFALNHLASTCIYLHWLDKIKHTYEDMQLSSETEHIICIFKLIYIESFESYQK